MSLASEIIARAYEGSNGCHAELSNEDLISQFLSADKDLGLLGMLRGLNAASKDVSEKKNVILIFGAGGDLEDLEMLSYRDATDALRALFQLEKERPGKDVVLVRAETSEEVRFAFRNYFSDASEFIELMDGGCQKLAGKKVIYGPKIKPRRGGKKAR